MVWIHGGGLSVGSANFVSEGDLLAHQGDVIVVGIQYRLGALGWFATEDPAYYGNLGLDDQRFALNWVKDNIAAFGGDPESVTLFGESAGAWSVSGHMISEQSAGLFHKAIGQSGSLTDFIPLSDHYVINSTMTLVETLGCERGSVQQSMDCMRTLPADLIVNVSMELAFTGSGYAMVADDITIPRNYLERIENGNINKVPVMWGNCVAEAGIFFLAFFPVDDNPLNRGLTGEEASSFVQNVAFNYNNPEAAYDALVGFYFPEGFDDVWKNLDSTSKMMADRVYMAPGAFKLDSMVTNGQPAFEYVFMPRPSFMPTFTYNPGAFHVDEIFFVFGEFVYSNGTQEEIQLSHSVMNAWASFAKTGTPTYLDNEGGRQDIPAYDLENRRYLKFDFDMNPNNAVDNNFRTEGKRFFIEVLPEIGNGYNFNEIRRSKFSKLFL